MGYLATSIRNVWIVLTSWYQFIGSFSYHDCFALWVANSVYMIKVAWTFVTVLMHLRLFGLFSN